MEAKTKYLILGCLIALTVNATYAQNTNLSFLDLTQFNWNMLSDKANRAKEVMQCNEIERTDKSSTSNIHSNPLLLNGKPLDYGSFDLNSEGLLTVVKGAPETADATPIPFYIAIRRNGVEIEDKKMQFLNKTLYQVNLSDIFHFCKQGDMLIIKPVKKEDWQAKRILKLIGGGC
jgi:hypothetical protein